jgi:hypothetical protein
MSSPKKKLSTGPIRIDLPVSKQEYSTNRGVVPAEESIEAASSQANTSQPEPGIETYIPEDIKQDSALPEDTIVESSKIDSALPEDTIVESSKNFSEFQETGIEESSLLATSWTGYTPKSVSSESGMPESGLTETEYKKVAMRLSLEVVESLRQLRATTGVPYEILVDVMIRNWDKLPQPIRAAYLQQAKQVRVERLMAGQEKTMKTMRTKYLDR